MERKQVYIRERFAILDIRNGFSIWGKRVRADSLQGSEKRQIPTCRRLKIRSFQGGPSIAFILLSQFDGFVHEILF
jgi:hypothetical protein